MNENPQDAPEGELLARFDDILGSGLDREFGSFLMISYSISMPNLLTFVADIAENQVFIDSWLKSTVFDRVTFCYVVANSGEGRVPCLVSEFQKVKIENVEAGATLSHPFGGALVSCSFECCSYMMDGTTYTRNYDRVEWSHIDGRTIHNESRFRFNTKLNYWDVKTACPRSDCDGKLFRVGKERHCSLCAYRDEA